MYPDDAITTYGEIDTSASTISRLIINGNTIHGNEYTILTARISSEDTNSTNRVILGCGSSASDANTISLLTFNGRSYASTTAQIKQAEVFGKIVCDENLYLFSTVNTTNEYQYAVTYVPYNTANQPRDINYGDFLYVSLVIIFILSFIGLGYLSSAFKPKQ